MLLVEFEIVIEELFPSVVITFVVTLLSESVVTVVLIFVLILVSVFALTSELLLSLVFDLVIVFVLLTNFAFLPVLESLVSSEV